MQVRLLPLALCTVLAGCATYAPYPYYVATPATTVVTPSVDAATGAVVQSPAVVYTYPAYGYPYPYPYTYAPYFYDPFPFFVSGTFLFSNGGHRHHAHHFAHHRPGGTWSPGTNAMGAGRSHWGGGMRSGRR
jgi:hypothetical protein